MLQMYTSEWSGVECTITVTAQAAFNDEVKIYVDMQAQIFSVSKAHTVPITLKQTVEKELENFGERRQYQNSVPYSL